MSFGPRVSFLLATLAASPAFAVTPPAHLSERPVFETHDGEMPRLQRRTGWTVPEARRVDWTRFAQKTGGQWKALWDMDTNVPLRIYGSGIRFDGSITDRSVAEEAARVTLKDYLQLLAPGTSLDDFEVVSNVLDGGIRTVGFEQHYQGLSVVGGQLSFSFKRDRLFVIGSEALPFVGLEASKTMASNEALQKSAASWVERDFSASVRTSAASGQEILPIVSASGKVEFHRVVEVRVDSDKPIGSWTVYVDAETAAPIARRQRLMFASGTLSLNVPERYPRGTRLDTPAPGLRGQLNGSPMTTAVDGSFTWPDGSPANITARAEGPLVHVINNSGSDITADFTASDGDSVVWNRSDNELDDAQLTTFISSQVVKAKVRTIAPGLTYLDEQLEANVNLNDVCNAFSDGVTINFFVAGQGCENTGRIPDVVYHEFGHSVHAHSIIRGAGSFDTSLSEGASDYLAAAITGDHGMGRGFFGTNQPLRDIDPPASEAMWPRDVGRDPHETGMIFAGAMWDLRKALIDAYGAQAGADLTDQLWYDALQRAADIPTSYVAILAGDDDDGDLSNGTPNICAINAAFAAHGLAESGDVGVSVGKLEMSGFDFNLPVGADSLCPGSEIGSATLKWRLRHDPARVSVIPMTPGAERFEASIPPQPDGVVVEYQVELSLQSGSVLTYPNNAADPWYQAFIGPVTPLYCTDFETDPSADGWTHELVSGTAREGADDWQWGEPYGAPESGDPSSAYSGSKVYGNDLGGGNFNGLYQSNKTNQLSSPVISTSDYRNIRVQYRRWLNVEDGTFDSAKISANGTPVWANLATGSNGSTHHEDREWRFHDVDVSDFVSNGQVQIAFSISSDGGLEFGGWTIDDFCVVAFDDSATASCGDGIKSQNELCDDGNTTGGDGCEADCTPTPPGAICGDGILGGNEQCDDGNDVAGDGCNADCTLSSAGGVCGNGIVEGNEACDDGNLVDGDGCSSACVPAGEDPLCPLGGPACGDDPGGITTLDEQSAGCGCSSTDVEGTPGALLLVLMSGLVLLRRRR